MMDEKALENMYRSAFPKVAAMVRRYGGDLEMARDVFQDAVLVLLERDEAPDHPEAYLIGIAKNLCRREARRPATIGLPADLVAPGARTSTPIWGYLRGAGARCLQLLQAFYYNNLSMEDIAGEFHYSSAHSATVQKYKCLERLREQLKASEVYEEVLT
ncbi:RNA polymerase sigma factor [Dinghuibacter silviterrae]|nr:sigma-70 family RNA polymerase sigma factor [Dinghuibacter silviterrae]